MVSDATTQTDAVAALAGGTGGGDPRDPSFEEWVKGMLKELGETRYMVSHWLKELRYYIEGPGASLETSERDKALCERSRMVVAAGETLDALTRIFVRWSDRSAPELAWDGELAASTDELLAQTAVAVQNDPFKSNCRKRLAYVRSVWSRWCPEFQPPKEPLA